MTDENRAPKKFEVGFSPLLHFLGGARRLTERDIWNLKKPARGYSIEIHPSKKDVPPFAVLPSILAPVLQVRRARFAFEIHSPGDGPISTHR